MIRVLHIIGSLRLGGAQVCLKQLVEHSPGTDVEHFIYPLRSRRIDIPIDGQVITKPYPNYDPRKLWAIRSLCRQLNIDILHAHLHKPIIAALLLRRSLNIPVIVHEHGSITRPGPQYDLYRFLLRRLHARADRFIAVSKASAEQLTRIVGVDPRRIEVVYNAVDTKTFVPDAARRTQWRDELHAGPETTVIGYAGRLSHEKGPDILLEAFALLVQKQPDSLLVFVGDGSLRAALQQRASDLGIAAKVRFLGFRKEVSAIMNAFDIGCVPSRQEAFGITAIELMSMRVPLVSSDVYGLAEIVADGRNALVPADSTPDALCGCLLRLIDDRDLRSQLTENAATDVRKFSIDTLVSRMQQIYSDVCTPKAR